MILAELGGTVTITDDPWPSNDGDVEITEEGGFWIELTVDDRASVAATQRFQRLGVRVDVTPPGGATVTLPDREVAAGLTIEESADNYGDRLTVKLAGSRFSPMARALLRTTDPIGFGGRPGADRRSYLPGGNSRWRPRWPHLR